jgi:hypothetical protein
MKIKSLFSVTASAMSIIFFILINLITSPGFPWCIFPIFAVLWWPISTVSYDKKNPLLLSIAGSLLSTVFFITVNLTTSAAFLWFVFPVFAILWWPLSMISHRKKSALFLAVVGSILSVIFFIIVNLMTSPEFMWCIYPVFAVLWWPLSLYCGQKKYFRALAVSGSIMTITLFFVTNFMTSKTVDWAFYPMLPVLFWPIGMFFKKHLKSNLFLAIAGMMTMAYYITLNVILSPGFPWSVIVAYEILLIISGIVFIRRNASIWFFVSGLAVTAVFLSSILWFPVLKTSWFCQIAFLSVSSLFITYLCMKRRYSSTLILGSVLTLAYLFLNNILYTPEHLWFLYTLFPIVWLWIMILMPKQAKTFLFALFSSVTGICYYAVLNLLMSPGYPWAIFPSFALLWWPLSIYYARTKKHFLFSVLGSILLTVFFIVTNLISGTSILWCVFPIFAVLWWPLSIYYFIYKRKKMKLNRH